VNQGVTVSWRAGDGLNADLVNPTWSVFHHETLPQRLLQELRQDAHRHIGCTTGRQGHDDANGLVGKSRLRRGDQRHRQQAGPQRLQSLAACQSMGHEVSPGCGGENLAGVVKKIS